MCRWIFSALSLFRQSADVYQTIIDRNYGSLCHNRSCALPDNPTFNPAASHTKADATESLAGRQHRPSASYVTPAIPSSYQSTITTSLTENSPTGSSNKLREDRFLKYRSPKDSTEQKADKAWLLRSRKTRSIPIHESIT